MASTVAVRRLERPYGLGDRVRAGDEGVLEWRAVGDRMVRGRQAQDGVEGAPPPLRHHPPHPPRPPRATTARPPPAQPPVRGPSSTTTSRLVFCTERRIVALSTGRTVRRS